MGNPAQGWTLVWIDARTAMILGWVDGPQVTRVDLETAPHERSVGHVRLVPGRHGGGQAQTALETHRLEHLRQGIERVAALIPDSDNVLVVGPGTVRERLAAELRKADEKVPASVQHRDVRTEAASRMTEPQLAERLRELVGQPPRRVHPRGTGAIGEG